MVKRRLAKEKALVMAAQLPYQDTTTTLLEFLRDDIFPWLGKMPRVRPAVHRYPRSILPSLLKRLRAFYAGGHGIGKTFHANPYVLHHKNDVNNGIMALGHTFTIEPLICEGTGERDEVARGQFRRLIMLLLGDGNYIISFMCVSMGEEMETDMPRRCFFLFSRPPV